MKRVRRVKVKCCVCRKAYFTSVLKAIELAKEQQKQLFLFGACPECFKRDSVWAMP